jgi:hypothetical protein
MFDQQEVETFWDMVRELPGFVILIVFIAVVFVGADVADEIWRATR